MCHFYKLICHTLIIDACCLPVWSKRAVILLARQTKNYGISTGCLKFRKETEQFFRPKDSGKMAFMTVCNHISSSYFLVNATDYNGLPTSKYKQTQNIICKTSEQFNSEQFTLSRGNGFVPPQSIKLSVQLNFGWVCFCDIILQSAHKHCLEDASVIDGKSKLVFSTISEYHTLTYLKFKKKKHSKTFFPLNKKVHLLFHKGNQRASGILQHWH